MPRRPGPRPATGPTPIQLRMLALVAEGYTDDEIRAELHRSRNAVHSGLGSAYRKLGARNRAHAVVLAMRRGLLPLHPPTDNTAP